MLLTGVAAHNHAHVLAHNIAYNSAALFIDLATQWALHFMQIEFPSAAESAA